MLSHIIKRLTACNQKPERPTIGWGKWVAGRVTPPKSTRKTPFYRYNSEKSMKKKPFVLHLSPFFGHLCYKMTLFVLQYDTIYINED